MAIEMVLIAEGQGNQSLILRMALDTEASFALLAHEPLQTLGYDLTLARQLGVDGLIGLNYLQRFHRIALNFAAGTLVLECPLGVSIASR